MTAKPNAQGPRLTLAALCLSALTWGCQSKDAGPASAPSPTAAEGDKAEDEKPEPAPEAAPEAKADPAAIDTPAAAAAIADGAVVLDVRTATEFESGALEGAVNIPHTQVEGELAKIRGMLEAQNASTVVVYCRSGRRSGIAAGVLDEAGVKVVNGGGYEDLKAATAAGQ